MSDARSFVNVSPIYAHCQGKLFYAAPTRRPHRFNCHLTGSNGQRIRIRVSGPDELRNCLSRLYRAGWLRMDYGRA
jgi:hypothetical protein